MVRYPRWPQQHSGSCIVWFSHVRVFRISENYRCSSQRWHRICWPIHGDQPANTVNLTDNHGVAYELFEVRSGNGLKHIYRTGAVPTNTMDALRAEVHSVLDKAFGRDGQHKRVNVQQLKDKIDAAWTPGGSADVDMRRLLDTLQQVAFA